MKIIKPQELALQQRWYQYQNQNFLALGVLLAQPFDGSDPIQSPVYSEADLWKMSASYLSDWDVFDEGMPKAQSEFLVYGHYHPLEDVYADTVSVQVAGISKVLNVTGERQWRTLMGSTNPEVLSVFPMDYQHAYGGKAYTQNPEGVGCDKQIMEDGREQILLPMIEYPDDTFSRPNKDIRPAGFRALSLQWSPRKDLFGTYGEHWQTHYAPGFANDIDWRIFNIAPNDQWLSGFLQGGESFSIQGMNDTGVVSGVTPNYRMRIFVRKCLDESGNPQMSALEEYKCHYETLWLYPAEQAQIGLWRTQVPIHTLDAKEIDCILIAYEHQQDVARPLSHYQNALAFYTAENPDADLDQALNLTLDLRPRGSSSEYSSLIETQLVQPVNLPGMGALGLLAGATGLAGALMKGGAGKAEGAQSAAQAASASSDAAGVVESASAIPVAAESAGATNTDEVVADAPVNDRSAEAVEGSAPDSAAFKELDELLAILQPQLDQLAIDSQQQLENLGLDAAQQATLMDMDASTEEKSQILDKVLTFPEDVSLSDVVNDEAAFTDFFSQQHQKVLEHLQLSSLEAELLAVAGSAINMEQVKALLEGKALDPIDMAAIQTELTEKTIELAKIEDPLEGADGLIDTKVLAKLRAMLEGK